MFSIKPKEAQLVYKQKIKTHKLAALHYKRASDKREEEKLSGRYSIKRPVKSNVNTTIKLPSGELTRYLNTGKSNTGLRTD